MIEKTFVYRKSEGDEAEKEAEKQPRQACTMMLQQHTMIQYYNHAKRQQAARWARQKNKKTKTKTNRFASLRNGPSSRPDTVRGVHQLRLPLLLEKLAQGQGYAALAALVLEHLRQQSLQTTQQMDTLLSAYSSRTGIENGALWRHDDKHI